MYNCAILPNNYRYNNINFKSNVKVIEQNNKVLEDTLTITKDSAEKTAIPAMFFVVNVFFIYKSPF